MKGLRHSLAGGAAHAQCSARGALYSRAGPSSSSGSSSGSGSGSGSVRSRRSMRLSPQPARCLHLHASAEPRSTPHHLASGSAPVRPPTRFTPSPSSSDFWHSTPPPTPPENDGSATGRVSDHEFDVRLGRAVALLRATLGDFMRIGLVDYDTNHTPGEPSSSGLGLATLDRLGLSGILDVLGASGRAKANHRDSLPPHLRHDADCPVYHPHITFKFRPPTSAAPGDSKATTDSSESLQRGESGSSPLLTFSGRSMYFASAHILRHALYALFSETTVVTERVNLHRGPHSPCSGGVGGGQGGPGNEPGLGGTDGGRGGGDGVGQQSPRNTTPDAIHAPHRQATLILRLTFTGVVRVTQQLHEYTVIFKYRFDPDTGMIIEHKVDRIEPVPGKKIWAGLSNAFARLAGFHPNPAGSTCHRSQALLDAASMWEGHHPAIVPGDVRGKDAQTEPAYIPALLRPQRPGPLASQRKALASNWQKRRSYTTRTQPAAATASAPAASPPPASMATQVEGSQPRFFSGPRSAEDMPGPSLTSIWLPSLGPSSKARSSGDDARGTELTLWAPTSNDPSVVAPASIERLPLPKDLTMYRPAAGVTSKTLPKIISGLSKSNLTVLVTLTGMAGYALCPAGLAVSSAASMFGPVGTLLALAGGTAMCSAAANAINQLREIPYDAQMPRTRNRVLPSRSITPLDAAAFASVSAVGGVATLATLNPLTASLGLANIVLYAFMYTPMKRRHIANTWLGAVVGALPPLMGWAACTGTLHLPTDAPAWCLAALLFAWQFPHFNSLSHNLSSEYARGGYRMMSVTNPALNRRTSLRYALALVPICSVALPLSGAVAALPYALLSLPPNLVLAHAAFRFWKQGTEKSARWCFWVSLVHLPVVMILAMATKKSLWDGVAEYLEWVLAEEREEPQSASKAKR